MFCRRCTLVACSTCCCRFRSVAPPSISSPSIKSSRRSQRPTRVRPGVLHRRSRARTRPDFSTRKLHARSLGHPTRWSRGGRPRVLPRPLSSRAATASPASGDLRAAAPMGGHSTVFETADKPRRDASGNPVNRTMLFRREQANIKDTWHVIGLRGTASNDYEVVDLFVREEYTTWRDSVPDRRESGPLYNIPLLTLYGVGFSGVALGIAGSCLAAFMQLAQTKSSGGGLGSTAVLRDNAVIQSRVAQACGQLGSARAFLVQMLRETWTMSAASGALSLEQRARLRVAITGAMEAARKVVDFAYRAAGAGAGAPIEFRIRGTSVVRDRARAEIVALQRLSAHEPRLGGPRRDTLAHDRPTQRTDTVHQKQAGRAGALQWQEIRKQAAVEEIDRQHAARGIGAAHAIVAVGQRSDIVPVPMGGDDEFADGRSVAQTEIETLRADRRNDVRGFPDECHPPGAETGGGLDH